MRGLRHVTGLAVVLGAALGAAAQDRELAVAKNPSDATGLVVVKFKLVKGDDVQWEVSPKPTDKVTFEADGYAVLVFNGPAGKYTATADYINWDGKKRGRPSVDVTVGKAPQPPPVDPVDPKPVDPKPVDPPAPDALKSFRVILVFDSKKVDPDHDAVLTGKDVEDWLKANCTGGRAGFRRRDVTAPGDADAPFAELWKAVQPGTLPDGRPDPNRITKVPCVVAARNEKVTIVDAETDPAKMIAALTKLREGK